MHNSSNCCYIVLFLVVKSCPIVIMVWLAAGFIFLVHNVVNDSNHLYSLIRGNSNHHVFIFQFQCTY